MGYIMKSKILTYVILAVITAILTAGLANASPVPWDSEFYAIQQFGVTWDDDIYLIPRSDSNGSTATDQSSLPISSIAEAEFPDFCTPGNNCDQWAGGFSEITTSTMSVAAWTNNISPQVPLRSGARASAWSSFTGEFTATQPVFQLDYDFTWDMTVETYDPVSISYDEVFGWIVVKDLTDGNNILDTEFFFRDVVAFGTGGADSESGSLSDTFLVNIPVGHAIEVKYGIQQGAIDILGAGMASSEFDATFSTSVVPEPISSTLFIIGGTFLAGRRYLKKRKSS
jgi:hypothetical protein